MDTFTGGATLQPLFSLEKRSGFSSRSGHENRAAAAVKVAEAKKGSNSAVKAFGTHAHTDSVWWSAAAALSLCFGYY